MRDHRLFVRRAGAAAWERDVNGEQNDMRPIVIDRWNEKCGRCGAPVLYTRGTGRMFHGASESYEEWETIRHKYCPECGEKVEREFKKQQQ